MTFKSIFSNGTKLIIAIAIAVMTGFRAAKAGKNPLLWAVIGFVVLLIVQNALAFFFFAVLGQDARAANMAQILGALLGIVATFLVLKPMLPILKYLAKPPDGVAKEYGTLEQLRNDLLSGKVTLEWVVRRESEAEFRPISEVLYPKNQ